jgi:two-component system NtrC family response regulator/two-component system response regulator HydG
MSENRGRILIADDEEAARRSLAQILSEDGYQVSLASNGEEALNLVAQESPDVLLTDLRMPVMDGHELLNRVRQGYPDVSVVIMTAHGTIASAVQAVRDGAEEYLTKPIDVEDLELLIERILKRHRLLAETKLLRERVDEKYRFENIIGRSPEMMEVYRLIEQVAPTQASILITGESGTGKELIAQAIHQRSTRRDAPFVKVSCAALPETLLESELFGHERGAFTGALARRAGRFEISAGGTIFLDEIGDIAPAMQVKLLRFLQERQFERVGGNQTLTVDVRVIAATHRNLQTMIHEGKFRDDLYYRLNVIDIPLPPLRARGQDIPLLVDYFIRRFGASNDKQVERVSDDALAALMAYHWPGNVRELEHAIERSVILSRDRVIDLSLFPTLPKTEAPLRHDMAPLVPGASLEEIERDAILRTLEAVGGSTSRAAAILKISARTIQYKLKQYRADGVAVPAAPLDIGEVHGLQALDPAARQLPGPLPAFREDGLIELRQQSQAPLAVLHEAPAEGAPDRGDILRRWRLLTRGGVRLSGRRPASIRHRLIAELVHHGCQFEDSTLVPLLDFLQDLSPAPNQVLPGPLPPITAALGHGFPPAPFDP